MWLNVIYIYSAGYRKFDKQEQQRVAVGPGNAHCMSIRQVSLRAAFAGSVL